MAINWDNLEFRFAKTMPESPHWYVKRDHRNEADYVELFDTIAREGRREKFRGATYRYWYRGDGYKYWAMTTDIRQSRIINRAKVDDGSELPPNDGV
jgi:hypothetical protein